MPDQSPSPLPPASIREDVERFNRLGDLWWDKNGKMGILHEINPIRVDYVRDHARRLIRHDAHRVNAREPTAGGLAHRRYRLRRRHIERVAGSARRPCDRASTPRPTTSTSPNAMPRTSGLDIDYRNITAEDLAETGETVRRRDGARGDRACRGTAGVRRHAGAAGEARRAALSRDDRPHARKAMCWPSSAPNMCWAGCRTARMTTTNSCARTNSRDGCVTPACGRSIAPA